MRYLVFICFAAVVALSKSEKMFSEEHKAKIIAIGKECQKETNVAMDLVKKAAAGEYVDDPKLKQQLLCFCKKAGFMTESGDFKVDVITKRVNDMVKNEKLSADIISKCIVKKSTPEDTAFESVKCFHQFAPNEDILS